jgi:hypothetical protein
VLQKVEQVRASFWDRFLDRREADPKDDRDDDDDMPGPNAGATLWPATLVRHRVVA